MPQRPLIAATRLPTEIPHDRNEYVPRGPLRWVGARDRPRLARFLSHFHREAIGRGSASLSDKMGAALSKLWGAFRTAVTGGGATGKRDTNHSDGITKDVENGLPTSNTPAKPPTPMPSMGGIKKYEITEVRLSCNFDSGGWRGSLHPASCEVIVIILSFTMKQSESLYAESSVGSIEPSNQITILTTVSPTAMDPLQLLPRRRALLRRKHKLPPLP